MLGLRDLDLGLDQDWWLHVLVNPKENDVITTEREKDKEILMRRHGCVLEVTCVIQELLLRGKKHSIFRNNRLLGNGKYSHLQQDGASFSTPRNIH